MYKKINSLLLIIIAFGVGLRLVNLSQLYHFTYDEEIIAFVGKRMFMNGHIPLIGGVTPMHVHLAPYFYWLSGIVLFLSKLNPLGWGIAAAFIAGFTLIMLYVVTKNLFNIKTAIIATILYAFSFYQNVFDRHYWGLIFDGLLSLLVIFSLYKIICKNYKYFLLLALTLAFGIHTDPSTLVLVLLTFITIILFKIEVRHKYFLCALIIFLGSFLPLIWFDLRHDFANIKGIYQYQQEIATGKGGIIINNTPLDSFLFIPRTLSRLIWVFGDTDLAKQYSYCSLYSQGRLRTVPNFLAFATFGLLLWFMISKSDKPRYKLLKILLVSVYSGSLVYGLLFRGDLFDHYLATLFPLFWMIVAFFIDKLYQKNRYLAGLVILLFIIFNLYQLVFSKHSYGFLDKENAVKWSIATIGNQDFALDVIGDCFKYNGYRYLYYLFGHEPVKSYVDANFSYLYDLPPAEKWPEKIVVLANPDFLPSDDYSKQYDYYKAGIITRANFGQIEALIIDNKNGQFIGDY